MWSEIIARVEILVAEERHNAQEEVFNCIKGIMGDEEGNRLIKAIKESLPE